MQPLTRNCDSTIQKAQGLMISGLCEVPEVCNFAAANPKRVLNHGAVLLLAVNEEIT